MLGILSAKIYSFFNFNAFGFQIFYVLLPYESPYAVTGCALIDIYFKHKQIRQLLVDFGSFRQDFC